MGDEQRWTVRTVDGHQYVYVGDPVKREGAFLVCEGGTLVNIEHVVALVPVG